MSRTSPPLEISENGGGRFENLQAAQVSARMVVVSDLAKTIKNMLENGMLEIKDGKIIPVKGLTAS